MASGGMCLVEGRAASRFVPQDGIVQRMQHCEDPLVESLLTNLWLAVERDTPVSVELLNAILTVQAGMLGIDCTLALVATANEVHQPMF
eukprot:65197-Amphidinium_carterae.1